MQPQESDIMVAHLCHVIDPRNGCNSRCMLQSCSHEYYDPWSARSLVWHLSRKRKRAWERRTALKHVALTATIPVTWKWKDKSYSLVASGSQSAYIQWVGLLQLLPGSIIWHGLNPDKPPGHFAVSASYFISCLIKITILFMYFLFGLVF